MASVKLSLPPASDPLVDARGDATTSWRRFFEQAFKRLGGATDNVFTAFTAALTALPNTTEVVAANGLQFGGALADNIPIGLYVYSGPVSGLPAAGEGQQNGDWAYATNGRNSGEGAGSGTGAPVVWYASGSIWRIPGVATTVTE